MEFSQIIAAVRKLADPGQLVYLVGGAVRDRLIGRACHDLDFVLAGETSRLAKRVANALDAGFFLLDPERDTSRVILAPLDGERFFLDFASLRAGDLEEDLKARDFSINAMALRLDDETHLIDPCGGQADVARKQLRACRPTSLEDDPARVLRAARLSVGLGYSLEADTMEQVRRAAPMLSRVSAERQRDELVRMLEGNHTSQSIRLLERLGALEYVLPDLLPLRGLKQPAPHVLDAWEHTLEVLDRLEDLLAGLVRAAKQEPASNEFMAAAESRLGRYREHFRQHFAQPLPNGRGLEGLLKFAALYHDTGKPSTGSTGKDGRLHFYGHDEVSARLVSMKAHKLAFSNEEIERCVTIVREHMRVHNLCDTGLQPKPRTIYRYFRDTGDAGVEVCLLSLADTWATYVDTLTQEKWLAEVNICRSLLEARWEKAEEIVSPPRLVNGHELIRSLRMEPGRQVGLLLEAIREGQAGGEIHSREDALAFATTWLAEQKEGSSDNPER